MPHVSFVLCYSVITRLVLVIHHLLSPLDELFRAVMKDDGLQERGLAMTDQREN